MSRPSQPDDDTPEGSGGERSASPDDAGSRGPPLVARLAKWTGITLLALLGVTFVSLVIWVNSGHFQSQMVPIVEGLVEQRTGERFSVGAIDVGLWPPSVEIHDARLWHEATRDSIVTVRTLRAPVVLRAGGPRLGRLTVVDPTLELHVQDDGSLREFQSMPPPREGLVGEATKPRRVPWGSLAVDNGTVRVHLPDGRLVITDLTVTPTEGYRADVAANLVFWYQKLEDQASLSWKDVRLGPDRFEIPDLTLDTELIRLQGRVLAPLAGPPEVEVQAHSDLERFNVLLAEPRALHGLVDVDARITVPEGEPRAEVVVLANHLALELPGANVPVIHYEFGTAVVAARADPDGAQVERLRLDTGDGVLEAWGRITPELELRDARVIVEDLGLAHILQAMDAAPTPWTDLSGDLEASVEGTLDPFHLEGPFDMAVSDWHTGDRPIADPEVIHLLEIPKAHARGTLLLEKDHARIRATHLEGPSTRGTADVRIGFGPKGPLDLRFDLPAADLSDFQPLGDAGLRGTGHITGRLWGPFDDLQIAGEGDVEGFEVLGIPYADRLITPIASPDMQSIVLTDARARIGDTRYAGNFTLDFRDPMSMDTDILISQGRAEDLIGMFVDLEGITGDLEGTLSLHGPLMDMDGEAHLTLTDVELYGEHFPYGEGHGYMDEGLFTLDDLRILRQDGRAGLILRGSVQREYALNMELVADGFALERLDHLEDFDLPLSGRLSAVARIDNTLYEPAPHGRITATDVRYAGVPLEDSVIRLRTEHGVSSYEGKLLGGSVAIAGTQGLWEDQPYSIFASLADFPAHVLYPEGANGARVEGSLSGQVDLSGHFGDDPGPVDLSVDVRDLVLRWRGHELRNRGPWHYEQHGRAFGLTGFALQGGVTDLALDRATMDAEGLDMRGGGRMDLDLLRAVVPGLSRSEGYTDLTFSAAGQGAGVETVVEAELVGALMRHDSFPEAFDEVRATVRATRDGFDLDDVSAGLGGGQITGGGRIDAEGWVPSRYNLHATARDAQVKWIDALPPAMGDAELAFDGPVDQLLLSGDVQIEEMVFSERIAWEDWVVEYRDWSVVEATPVDEEPLFALDVGITADETITLRNNVAEGTASADLRIIGDTVRAGLTGQITIDDALVYLQDREFQVERGLISYRDPWTWDPILDFELVTDITSREQRYRVHYLIRGPFSDWRTETRSEPSLPQADINALLWFGVTAEELEGMGELPQAVAQGVADMILTDLFITRGGGVRDELGSLVDRVEIATGVDSRGEYSPDPRLLVEKRVDSLDTTLRFEVNTTQWDDWQIQSDWQLEDNWSLAWWYARRQRDRPLPFGGATGLDLRARWELE